MKIIKQLSRVHRLLFLFLLVLAMFTSTGYAKEVTFWTWTAGDRFQEENEILDLFRERNPYLNLVYAQNDVRRGDALLVAIIGDAAPDLVTTHQDWHRDLAKQGAFLDLRPFIERDGFDLSVFPQELMEYYTGPNGEITGFPWQFTTIVLAYNERLFDSAAVAYPTADWDLDDMVQAARKLTIKGPAGTTEQWGLNTGVLWEYVWRLWGVNFMAEDGTKSGLSDPRAVEAFDWYPPVSG